VLEVIKNAISLYFEMLRYNIFNEEKLAFVFWGV